MELFDGGVTSPKGFKATGDHVGIKKVKKDLSMVISDVPAVCAGVFTTNKVKAAPVNWDMDVLAGGRRIRAVLTNSGNANACTGAKGAEDTAAMAEALARMLDASPKEVLVCSTGVIGQPLPIDKILSGVRRAYPGAGYGLSHGQLAAEAIMTTDTFMKTAAITVEIGGKDVTIGGMAKGSGMIHPNMATLLAFITTDCAISRELLQKALSHSADYSYNMISVDGDQSTNDTLLLMANGLAGNPEITEENEDYAVFSQALGLINRKLAIDIARDGEGATRLIETTVAGAKTEGDARVLARSVVSSSLFKAMIFGADANWGRILCAMGYSGADFDPEGVSVSFRSVAGIVALGEKGLPLPFDEGLAKTVLLEKDIFVDISLNEGNGKATAWGCDLTYDYVRINGDYRS